MIYTSGSTGKVKKKSFSFIYFEKENNYLKYLAKRCSIKSPCSD